MRPSVTPEYAGWPEGALALDQDEVGRGPGRLEHQLLGGAGDEVRDHGVDADAPPRDDRRRSVPVGTNSGERPASLAARSISRVAVILPMALSVPTVSATFGPTPKPSPEKSGMPSGGSRTSQTRLAGELGREPLVEAADDLEPGVRRSPQGLHPLFREPPARGGEPDQDGGRRELQRLSERPDYGGVAPEVGQDVEPRVFPASVESMTQATSSLP